MQQEWNPYDVRNVQESNTNPEQTLAPQPWQWPMPNSQYPSYYEVPMPHSFPYPRNFRSVTNSGDEIEYELRFFPGPVYPRPFYPPHPFFPGYGPVPIIRPLPPVPLFPPPPIFW